MNCFPEYVQLTLQEIPSEISVVVPLAGCSHSCYHCHSPHLQDRNGGEEFTAKAFEDILEKYRNKASCFLVFGGEYDTQTLHDIFVFAIVTGKQIGRAHV